ncbi:MAG: thioesterase [Balneolaceae bacterium]|nr:thioesterase [Balneolaceae bacterium]
MIQEQPHYSESFKIRSSEVRTDGKLKVQNLCDLLQETAGNHALELNFDVTQLHEHSRTWMLHRIDIKIEQYPEWRDRVTVRTWPSSGDSLRAYRDFLVLDSAETVLARALSYWLMIDLESRRPVRIPQEVLEMAPAGAEHVLPVSKGRPSPPENSGIEKIFSIRRSDLDVNDHVNNIRYVEWITETLGEDDRIERLDIEFKAECGYGNDVEVGSERTGNRVRSSVGIKEDEKILATAEMQLF